MSTSLEDFSTFQFMLANPSIAGDVTSQCTSFVFYNVPKDDNSKWSRNYTICHGDINTFNYYICCLMVLPSHMLGMSKWISAEDKSSEARKYGDELRRFRYSYYGGFMNVDTRHVCVNDRDGSSGSGDEQFRLVEYFDCSMSVWMFAHAMFVLLSSMVAYGIQKSGLLFIGDTSLSSTVGIVYVAFHVIMACSGVNIIFVN
eukprot:CAMPEP_0201686410 /NCGR_PEP_ID=MMETSP0578-20130828/868_1 /ASSEMBLY_ACC=CAM_ASM_000663 /TAXON_ID=267565 /ORGANISM="Skeletonema grethea, Strain CCMP 1804" /LENGTH=200 /DNA_ID=CAMNT_0048170465 /DNA_START=160 /DNA_END=762 /DNA_ORIENTATION=-